MKQRNLQKSNSPLHAAGKFPLLIFIINMIGSNFAFHIGLNLFTSILVGFLGIPGAGLLVILQIILGH